MNARSRGFRTVSAADAMRSVMWLAVPAAVVGVVIAAGMPDVRTAVVKDVLGYVFFTAVGVCAFAMLIGATRETTERHRRAHQFRD